MTGYSKALCSILGTLLGAVIALALVASPSAAQGKKKKAAEEAPAAEESAEGGGSLDSLMEGAAAPKKDKKAKKGKAQAEEEQAEEPPPAEEEVAEPDAWERPPMEEKAPPKEAPPPVEEKLGDGKQISVGLLLGYGFKTDRQTGGLGVDPYGLMAGLRGGYTFDFALYAGAYFKYFLGSSGTTGSGRIATESRDVHASYMQFGLEAGYDLFAGPVILRPSLELGMALAFSDADGTTRSVGDLMFGPGVAVLYPFDDLFLGGDLRGSLVTGDGVSGVTIAANGGMRF